MKKHFLHSNENCHTYIKVDRVLSEPPDRQHPDELMFLKGTQIYPSPLWCPITLEGHRIKQVWSLLSSLISFSVLPSPLSCLLGLAKWTLFLGLVKCIPTLWPLHLQHVLPGGNFLLSWPKMSFLAQCLPYCMPSPIFTL